MTVATAPAASHNRRVGLIAGVILAAATAWLTLRLYVRL